MLVFIFKLRLFDRTSDVKVLPDPDDLVPPYIPGVNSDNSLVSDGYVLSCCDWNLDVGDIKEGELFLFWDSSRKTSNVVLSLFKSVVDFSC